jgi:hypothetical protein
MIDHLKNSWKSATIWFNGILLAALPLVETAKDSLPQMQEYVTADIYKWVGLFVVISNIALRFKTSKPLSEK